MKREKYKMKKEIGECTMCGDKAIKNRTKCDKHSKLARISAKKYYKKTYIGYKEQKK